jgi:TetR/AcrR family transcriptional repressor of nem operon
VSDIWKILELAVELGEIEAQNTHTKALALQNLVFGLNVMSKVIRDEKELWAIAKHSLEALQLYSE